MSDYALGDQVIAQTLDDQTVLLDVQRGLYFELNVTGSLILSWVLESASSDEIALRLQSRFQVNAETARTDVESLLSALLSQQLLRAAT